MGHSLFVLETSCTHFELIYQFHEKMEEVREKFYAGNASATEAFEEMFARLAELEAERECAREMAKARVDALVARNATLRTKNQNLRAKYVALLDMYNVLAEEV